MNREEAIGNLKYAIRWNDMPVKEAMEMAIKALEQDPCEDAVSRQEVKERMIKYGFHAPDMTVTEFVDDLPSVDPQPKMAHWINEGGLIPKCSNCGIYSDDADKGYDSYCPNCGANKDGR